MNTLMQRVQYIKFALWRCSCLLTFSHSRLGIMQGCNFHVPSMGSNGYKTQRPCRLERFLSVPFLLNFLLIWETNLAFSFSFLPYRFFAEWQIYVLLLGLFLASAMVFYIFYEHSDSFWNFPLGRNQPARPFLRSLISDSQFQDDQSAWWRWHSFHSKLALVLILVTPL